MAEASEAKPADHAAPAPAAGGAKSDKLSLILLLVTVINLGVIGGLGLSMQKMWARIKDLNAKAEKAASEPREAASESPMGKEQKPQSLGVLYPLESFLVNISSDQGPKFLQTQMELELEDPAMEDEIALKRPAVRDAIIVLLSSRSYRDLRDANGMRTLRADLLRAVNSLLSSGKVKEIYFTQFHFN